MTTSTKTLLGFAALLAVVSATATPAHAAVFYTSDFNTNNGGFTASTVSGSSVNPFTYSTTQGVGSSGAWYVSGTTLSTKGLTSSAISITQAANVLVNFSHLINFESPYDGGQLQFSVNGGAFTTVLASQITGRTYNNTPISTSFGSAIGGQRAWSFFNENAFVTSTANLGSIASGSTLQIRFFAAWDSSGTGPGVNWAIDNVTVSSAAVPEPSSVLGLFAIAGLGGGAFIKRRKAIKA